MPLLQTPLYSIIKFKTFLCTIMVFFFKKRAKSLSPRVPLLCPTPSGDYLDNIAKEMYGKLTKNKDKFFHHIFRNGKLGWTHEKLLYTPRVHYMRTLRVLPWTHKVEFPYFEWTWPWSVASPSSWPATPIFRENATVWLHFQIHNQFNQSSSQFSIYLLNFRFLVFSRFY